jgi:rod shape-determining protein MreC
MAFAGGGINRPSGRDSSPGPRFFFFACLSLVLMYFDQRDDWSSRLRYALQAVAYPVQVVVGSPGKLWSATTDLFETRGSLRSEVALLRKREQELSLITLRYATLETENARLRNLNKAPPPLVNKHLLGDVVNADLGRLRQRLVINQGDRNGVFRTQSVIDSAGLIGQVYRVGPFSAEIMLITDPDHAVPVEIVRSGLRTIAVGTGNEDELQLPFVPVGSDVKAGDRLVTSGMGGVFPAGVPVGTITEFKRDPDQLLAQVQAKPSAALARDRQVLLLWFTPRHPAAPVDQKLIEQLPPPSVASPVMPAPEAKP